VIRELPTTSLDAIEAAAAEQVLAALAPLALDDRQYALAFVARRFKLMLKRHRKPYVLAERGTAKQAAAILGLKSRKLQSMSQRGEIPGAAKLGRQWTYDLAKLRRFVEQQEQACQQGSAKPRPAAIGAGKLSTAARGPAASWCGGRLKQMIQQSQRRVAKQAKREP
jgi:Helix-turn-helix domain